MKIRCCRFHMRPRNKMWFRQQVAALIKVGAACGPFQSYGMVYKNGYRQDHSKLPADVCSLVADDGLPLYGFDQTMVQQPAAFSSCTEASMNCTDDIAFY